MMRVTMQATMLLMFATSVLATPDGCCVLFYGKPAATSAGGDQCDLCPVSTAESPWNVSMTCRDSVQHGSAGVIVDSTKKDCITWDYVTNTTTDEIFCFPGATFKNSSHWMCKYRDLPNDWTLQGSTDTSEFYAPVPPNTKYFAEMLITLPLTMAAFDSSTQTLVIDALSVALGMDTPFYGVTRISGITPGPRKEYGADRTPDLVHATVRVETTNETVILEAQDKLGIEYADFSTVIADAVHGAIGVKPVFPFKLERWSRYPPQE